MLVSEALESIWHTICRTKAR